MNPEESVISILLSLQMLKLLITVEVTELNFAIVKLLWLNYILLFNYLLGTHLYLTWRYSAIWFWQLGTLYEVDGEILHVSNGDAQNELVAWV